MLSSVLQCRQLFVPVHHVGSRYWFVQGSAIACVKPIYQVTCIACVYLPEGLLCKHGYSCLQGVLPTVATMLSVFRLPGLQVPCGCALGPTVG